MDYELSGKHLGGILCCQHSSKFLRGMNYDFQNQNAERIYSLKVTIPCIKKNINEW